MARASGLDEGKGMFGRCGGFRFGCDGASVSGDETCIRASAKRLCCEQRAWGFGNGVS